MRCLIKKLSIMENSLFKTQRQIVEELITEYLNLCKAEDELRKMGINIELKLFRIDNLLDWAMDIIGFPQDTSLLDDEAIGGKSFCRDYLTNSTLLDPISGEHRHDTVEEYADFLYRELESLKKESPELFQ